MSDSDNDYDWSARKRTRSDNSGDDGAAVVAAPAPPAAVPALAIVQIAGASPPMHAAPALGEAGAQEETTVEQVHSARSCQSCIGRCLEG